MTDVLDVIKNEVLSYRTLLRAISFMGWPVMLASYLPGFIGVAAEVAIHTAPGIAEGESFSDAFVTEYVWRLKLAASYLCGVGIAQASAAAAGALQGTGTLGGLGITTAVEDKLKEALAAAKKEIGEEAVKAIEKEANAIANEQVNRAFERLVANPTIANQVKVATEAELRSIPNLRQLAQNMSVREDVAAMAVNALRHEHLFSITPDKFSVRDGRYIGPIDGREQEGDVLVPIIVEDSGAFAETPEQARKREAVEHGLEVLTDQRAAERVVRSAGIVLAPLAVVWFLRR